MGPIVMRTKQTRESKYQNDIRMSKHIYKPANKYPRFLIVLPLIVSHSLGQLLLLFIIIIIIIIIIRNITRSIIFN